MIDIGEKHPTLQFTKDEVVAILAHYNRTIENVTIDIKSIQEWIQSQPHLTQIPEERMILSILINNKFSMDKVKKVIDDYYSIRGMIPEVYENRLPNNEDIHQIRNIVRTFTLPRLVNLNRVIFFVLDEMNHKFDPFTYVAKSILDVEAIMYRSLFLSVEVVFDCTNSNLAYWSTFTPVVVKTIMTVLEKIASNRFRALRIIGLPTVAHVVINAAIAYLPQKIRNRVSMHSEKHEIIKFYPLNQLPKEYGGEGASYREMAAQFGEMVNGCVDYFRGIQNYRVDPKLRPEKLDNDEFLGYYGYFRQVDVD